ncbi:MAG: LamG domain-containing protein [Treponema sp.]|jgi:hypothetical protein|nr:LamG domain-containing protein [Treponema sp.]
MKKVLLTLSALFCAALFALSFAGCPDDRELLIDADLPPFDPVVTFVVNSAGTGFEKRGDADVPAPTKGDSNGVFEAVNGLYVFNTKGTANGTDTIGWATNLTWTHYDNIGYINFDAAVADMLVSLSKFSIAMYFCLPIDAQTDRADHYLFSFTDNLAPSNGLLLNWGNNIKFQKFVNGTETVALLDFNNSQAKLGSLGDWHHVVVTVDGTTINIYLDGNPVLDETSATMWSGSDTNTITTYPWHNTDIAAGTLVINGINQKVWGNASYGQQLFNTKFYKFAIYDEVLTNEQAMGLATAEDEDMDGTPDLDQLNGY